MTSGLAVRQIENVVKKIDGELKANDPRFKNSISIVLKDGTCFFLDRAFAVNYTDNKAEQWVFVFTECHGFYFYKTKELSRCKQFSEIPIESI